MANFNLNKAILGGRMVSTPELKQTPSGVAVCSFSIAVNRRVAKDAEQQVDFINCQAWRNTAEFIAKYFRKGSSICIVGQIQTRSWQDQQGNKRYVTEVVVDEANFVDSKSDVGQASAPYIPDAYTAPSGYIPQSSVPTDTAQQQAMSFTPKPFAANETDDDLPF
ncbi:MAG: single-stranded DNA-binding protein [Clostridia bacterium]|nr:single-stranded DNA-binding protein [Clostridia bacterium]